MDEYSLLVSKPKKDGKTKDEYFTHLKQIQEEHPKWFDDFVASYLSKYQ
jgi:hypothetical protein